MRDFMSMDSYIDQELRRIIPEKTYTSLKKINSYSPQLFASIQEAAKAADLTPTNYLGSLGYFTTSQWAKNLTDQALVESIDNDLKLKYPSGSIKTLREIQKNQPTLYIKIKELAKRKKLTPLNLMSDLGYLDERRRQPNANQIDYDFNIISQINEDYDITLQEWGDFLGLTKERVRQIFGGKTRNKGQWESFEITPEEFNIIKRFLVDKRETFYRNEDISFMLLTNCSKIIKKGPKAPVKVFLLVRNGNTISYTEDLIKNEDYRRDLYRYGYLHFLPEKVAEAWEINDHITREIDHNPNYTIDNNIHNKIKQVLKSSLLESVEDYFGFFGINSKHAYQDSRYIDEAEYHQRLVAYVNENGILRIPINEDYRYFANVASRKGMSISNFFESIGYKYVRPSDDYHQQIEENILKRRLSEDTIFIDTKDPFYSQFHAYVKRHSKDSFNTYLLEKYKLKRVFANELTHSDEIYPYWLDLEEFENLEEEKVKEIILSFLDERDKLVISFNSNLYKQLGIFARSIQRYPLSLLKSWKIDYEIVTDAGELDPKAKYLEELERLDSSLTKEESTVYKAKRSQELVRILKKLYNYQCQLCSEEEGLPQIIKENGDRYIEMHHIQPVSDFKDDGNDESSKTIDSYKNCVIICPHHHKVLHYHQGGFPRLEKVDDKLYFINKLNSEERIPLKSNYHL